MLTPPGCYPPRRLVRLASVARACQRFPPGGIALVFAFIAGLTVPAAEAAAQHVRPAHVASSRDFALPAPDGTATAAITHGRECGSVLYAGVAGATIGLLAGFVTWVVYLGLTVPFRFLSNVWTPGIEFVYYASGAVAVTAMLVTAICQYRHRSPERR